MTKDDITRMAKDAGFCGFDGENKCLREFANLVAEAERKECAKVAEWVGQNKNHIGIAAAIRARGHV
tara:strand:+ start:700 stop:900 length:201 start_codon:yes stop_codon:yes gene_type:complete